MKVLLFLPKAFEHMESSVFIDVLGWARHEFSHDIQLVTAGFTRDVVSTFNIPIQVNALFEEIVVKEYDALAIPGGFGSFGYLDEAHDERLLELIREFNRQEKPISAVCMAGMSLGKSGVLKGRKSTTYHLRDSPRLNELSEYGAIPMRERIVVDRNVITSCGPETAIWVAFKLLEMLTSKKQMEEVKDAMGYRHIIDQNGEVVER